jgi:hypothetical protein
VSLLGSIVSGGDLYTMRGMFHGQTMMPNWEALGTRGRRRGSDRPYADRYHYDVIVSRDGEDGVRGVSRGA